jgi:hypothetical protein
MNTPVQANQIDIEGYHLKRRLKNSASWFYWIAGLSMINWIASNLKIGFVMVIGLGATQLIDGIAQELITDLGSSYIVLLTVVSFAATLAISGMYALFGYFGNKRANWAFIIGIIFYVLDVLIFIWAKDWLPLIFHAWALISLLSGPGIIKRLKALEEGQPAVNYIQPT